MANKTSYDIRLKVLLLTGVLIWNALGFVSLPSYADNKFVGVTRVEFSKYVVELFDFEMQEVPVESYFSKFAQADDYAYTALQLGLWKGCTPDFNKVPMDTDEIPIVLANARKVKAGEVEPIVDGVRLPSDFTFEDDLWTPEEFERFMNLRYLLNYKWEGENHYPRTSHFEDGRVRFVDNTDKTQRYHSFEKQGYERIASAMYNITRPLMQYALENDDAIACSIADFNKKQGAAFSYMGSIHDYHNYSPSMFSLVMKGYEDRTFEGYDPLSGKTFDGFDYDSIWKITDLHDTRDHSYEDWMMVIAGTKEDPYSGTKGIDPIYDDAFKIAALNAYENEVQGLAFYEYVTEYIRQNYDSFQKEDDYIINIGGIDYYYRRSGIIKLFYFNNPAE